MQPAVALPREDDAASREEQRVARPEPLEDAAAARRRAPEEPPGARRHVGHADLPRVALAARDERVRLGSAGLTQVDDAAAVGGEDRVRVRVGPGVEPADRPRREVVDADDRVVAAPAHEGEPRAVSRQPQLPRAPARREEPLVLAAALERGDARLPAAHEVDAVTRRRRDRPAAVRETARLAAVERHGEQLLPRAGPRARRVRDLAPPVGVAPADEQDGLRPRTAREREVPDLLAVVGRVRGEPPRGPRRRLGGPDVACAVLVHHPRHRAAVRRGNELARERRGQDLLEGERRGGRRGGGRSLLRRCRSRRRGEGGDGERGHADPHASATPLSP